MKLGASRLNKMPYENWRMLRVGYSETAFIMKECKGGSICYNKVTTISDIKGRRIELDTCQIEP